MGLTAAACVVFVAAMVGASFAAVPLYGIFCSVTGIGGTTRRVAAPPTATLDRVITVRFDTNVANGLGWTFRPAAREVRVKLGEIKQVSFIAENRTDHAETGTAAFNVSPFQVGSYFNKLACFCFTDQTLAAGERAELPVTFFVDPALARDPDEGNDDTITLSYTFYPKAAPAAPVADLGAGAKGG